MNIRKTLKLLGSFLASLAFALLIPLGWALLSQDGAAFGFIISALLAGAAGAALNSISCKSETLSPRDGFAIVTFAWIAFAIFGAFPYYFSEAIPELHDAIFESMSGFTTTGASVIEAHRFQDIPESIFLWRAMTQWLGGMGIIVLSLAILPFLSVGGMQLFKAEMPGPSADHLLPRMQDTAKALWGVYALLTAVLLGLLWMGEMNFHEALCHALTTMATGGFSTRGGSINEFGATTQAIITVFMLLAGVNFALHFSALRGKFSGYWKGQEIRLFFLLFGGATGLIWWWNLDAGGTAAEGLLDAAFTVASISTTTGFVTEDYALWPSFSACILLALMGIGGCAGSTSGGMKIVRVLILLKHARQQLIHLVHPRQVTVLRHDHAVVSKEVSMGVVSFVVAHIVILISATLLMAATGLDPLSAGASALTCLSNVGPGLGSVGPYQNFAHVSWAGQLVLEACMLLGRLELFTVLVLFLPSFWRR